MQLDSDAPFDESEDEFTERIRTETREKILLKSTPIDLEALRKSMELPDSSYSGNIRRIRKPRF